MSIGTLVVTLLVLFLICLSVRERMRWARFREKDWDVIGESKSSPLSRALTALVGTAGGIYLAMILLVTFLELQVPQRVDFGIVSLEPIATVSILLAIIQPFALKVFKLHKHY